MKKAIVILSVLMLFAASSFATRARVDSLGLNVSPWMVQDEYLTTKYFPQMVVNYDNMAKIEYGTAPVSGQANLNLGPGVLGVIANIPNVSLTIAPTVNSTGAIYGLDMKGMSLGFGLTYGTIGTKNTTGAINGNVGGSYGYAAPGHGMNFGIVAGLGVNLGKNMPLDLGLRLNIPSYYTTDTVAINATGVKTNQNQTGKTGIELAVDGRITLPGDMMANVGVSLINSTNLILVETFNGVSGTMLTHTEDATAGTNIGFTIGVEKTVQVGSAMVIFGLDPFFNSNSTTETNANKMPGGVKLAGDNLVGTTTIKIPLYVGVENKLNETWLLRGGVSKNVWDLTSTVTKGKDIAGNVTSNTTADVTADAAPAFTIGFGAKFGEVSIDGNVATSLLTNGPYFITGAPSAFASEIAISYNWK